MTLIRNKQVQTDHWHYLKEASHLINTPIIVDLEYWQANKDTLINKDIHLGLKIFGDTAPATFAGDLIYFKLIAIEIPSFVDGRGYSLARILREFYHYSGELRAIGDIQPDQALYLTRVGFDALELENDDLASLAIDKLGAFSVFYQPAGEEGL
jgi:uncharacterized protein (DUF934 family)|tara:strand:+ start:7320 stop:7781 length:462 start_codon:yes stop_codon:yes gene_type:complete